MVQNEYLNVREVAILLGRTEKAIRRLVERRQIPHFRVGRRLQFRTETIHRWMARHRRNGAYVDREP